jgi:hypothetical protein
MNTINKWNSPENYNRFDMNMGKSKRRQETNDRRHIKIPIK